jgi:hypothetical protein
VVWVPAVEDEAVVLALLSLRALSLARFSLRVLSLARFSAVRA